MSITSAAEPLPTSPRTRKPRRMARPPEPTDAVGPAPVPPSKLDTITAKLLAEGGTTIAELMAATGWLQHSLRGAMAGALKKRGLIVTSEKIEGVRRYRASRPE